MMIITGVMAIVYLSVESRCYLYSPFLLVGSMGHEQKGTGSIQRVTHVFVFF